MSFMSNLRASLFPSKTTNFTPVNDFQFHDLFLIDTVNGLVINGYFIPEEVLTHILSFVDAKQLLSCSRVCKMWCNVIKSDLLWRLKYVRMHPKKKGRLLPWYVYYSYFATDNFDKNLLKNGSAESGDFSHWTIVASGGDGFKVEPEPVGGPPIPSGIEDFNGSKACFVTSYDVCQKIQFVDLRKKRLLRYIMDKYMPHIYASEWISTRFDCGGRYILFALGLHSEKDVPDLRDSEAKLKFATKTSASEVEGTEWKKMEITADAYQLDITHLALQDSGCDSKFWAGLYGIKMSGAVLKIIFDSIEPLEEGQLRKSRSNLKDLPSDSLMVRTRGLRLVW